MQGYKFRFPGRGRGARFRGWVVNLFDNAPLEAGKLAAESCEAAAERRGWDSDAAAEFVLAYLADHGPTPGEVLVTEASKGNAPHDARAFGGVFLRLSRRGLIVKCGYALRAKGHGTHGGLIWRLA